MGLVGPVETLRIIIQYFNFLGLQKGLVGPVATVRIIIQYSF